MLAKIKENIGTVITIASVLVAAAGFIINTTKGAIQVTNTLERVNETQQIILETASETSEKFDTRLTDLEEWKLRKEGYDAAIAEIEARSNGNGN
jgi:soluble cytochrome b562